MDEFEKQYGTSSLLRQALSTILKPSVNSISSYSPEMPNSGQNGRFLVLCDLEIWWMTLKNNRAYVLCYFKLCASFLNHQWIQTWVTIRKSPIRVKIGDFWSRVTLKFDGWTWKSIGHLFYATSSFVRHFTTIGEFKLELQSENAQFWSKSAIFVPCDLEIWRLISKNDRAPLLYYCNLCASFRSHL